MQLWGTWNHHAGAEHEGRLCALFILIVQQRVGNRPGRIEPCAIKRRPNPFPLLTEVRAIAGRRSENMGMLGRLSKCHSDPTPYFLLAARP